jgi:hypothetical protein
MRERLLWLGIGLPMSSPTRSPFDAPLLRGDALMIKSSQTNRKVR